MSPDQFGWADGERRSDPNKLVARLNLSETYVLVGLVRGLSKGALAAASNQSIDELEGTLASMMTKLSAPTIIDAIRIGLEAHVDRTD